MSSSNLSTTQFLDDMKQGWGGKYGPVLQALGLDDLDDAQGLTEVDLKVRFESPLRDAGAPVLHVDRIVKHIYLINSKQGNKNTINPNPLPTPYNHNPPSFAPICNFLGISGLGLGLGSCLSFL
jgi:hypothetical protein